MPTPIVRLLGDPTSSRGTTVDQAISGGLASDRLGLAFAAGYRAALAALLSRNAAAAASGIMENAALCATEEGGAHPKAIATSVRDGRVTGRKTFVTMPADVAELLVIAREDDGTLRMVAVPANAPGVRFDPMPPLPFTPEIAHAAVQLTEAPGVMLPGDGYNRYLKPFRTIEDIHVLIAALAYLFGAGRRQGWDAPPLARIAACVQTFAALADEDPLAPTTHLVLHGALDLARSITDGAKLDGDEGARWERDRPLLRVAEKVRWMRLASACKALQIKMPG